MNSKKVVNGNYNYSEEEMGCCSLPLKLHLSQSGTQEVEASSNSKECERCKRNQPIDEFYKKSADRYDHWCKACRRDDRKSRYRGHLKAVPALEPVVGTDDLSNESVDWATTTQETVEGSSAHPKLPQYTFEEVKRAVAVFEMLIVWRDEERRKGTIDW